MFNSIMPGPEREFDGRGGKKSSSVTVRVVGLSAEQEKDLTTELIGI